MALLRHTQDVADDAINYFRTLHSASGQHFRTVALNNYVAVLSQGV